MSKILCPCLVPSIQVLKVLCLFWPSEKAQGLLLAYSPAGEPKKKKSLNLAEHQLVCWRSTEKSVSNFPHEFVIVNTDSRSRHDTLKTVDTTQTRAQLFFQTNVIFGD